jgi:voltage-gated potassium channel
MSYFKNLKHNQYKYRVYIATLLMLGSLSFGVLGFMLVENYSFLDALYMAFVTISTVGFGLLMPLSPLGKIFLILLITINLSIVTYAITIVTSYFFDGEYQLRKKLLQMNQQILKLKNHCVVCGYGRNGQQAVEVLLSHHIPFVVIEENEKLIEVLKEKKMLYIKGDATLDKCLMDANVAQALSLITTLPEDAKNLFVVLTAREMNAQAHIISRASVDTSVRKLKSAGANNVIMPDKLGGSHMASLLVKPDVIEFIDYILTQNTSSIIEEIFINESSPLLGKSIKEINIEYNINTIGLKDDMGNYTINPSLDLTISSKMSLIVIADKEILYKLKSN